MSISDPETEDLSVGYGAGGTGTVLKDFNRIPFKISLHLEGNSA